MDEIRKAFSGADPEELDKAIAAAGKKVKPAKTKTVEYTDKGEYNAVGLPVVPYAVVKVTDTGKTPLRWELVGQQVVASRRFEAPVVIEYGTGDAQTKWIAEMIAAVGKELEK